jgi:hypothetical protein
MLEPSGSRSDDNAGTQNQFRLPNDTGQSLRFGLAVNSCWFGECLLLGVKRTSTFDRVAAACDPKQTSKIQICVRE